MKASGDKHFCEPGTFSWNNDERMLFVKLVKRKKQWWGHTKEDFNQAKNFLERPGTGKDYEPRTLTVQVCGDAIERASLSDVSEAWTVANSDDESMILLPGDAKVRISPPPQREPNLI